MDVRAKGPCMKDHEDELWERGLTLLGACSARAQKGLVVQREGVGKVSYKLRGIS